MDTSYSSHVDFFVNILGNLFVGWTLNFSDSSKKVSAKQASASTKGQMLVITFDCTQIIAREESLG
jgi:hypothetical protein